MRVTITYNLDDEMDSYKFSAAMQAVDLLRADDDFYRELRNIYKYGDLSESAHEAVSQIKAAWHDTRNENNIMEDI